MSRRISTKRWIGRLLLIATLLSLAPQTVLAASDPLSPLAEEIAHQGESARQSAGYADPDDSSVQTAVGRFVNVLTTFLGAILIVLMVYAGFLWMTSGGNDTQIDKAKSILRNSIIGLAILLSAYAITKFVVRALVTSTRAPDYSQSFREDKWLPNLEGIMNTGNEARQFSDPQPLPPKQ